MTLAGNSKSKQGGPLPLEWASLFMRFETRPPNVPSPDTLISPTGDSSIDNLWELVARRNLKRLMEHLAHVDETNPNDGSVSRELVFALARMPSGQLDNLLTGPELTSWLYAIENLLFADRAIANSVLAGFIAAQFCFAGENCPTMSVPSMKHFDLLGSPQRLILHNVNVSDTIATINGRLVNSSGEEFDQDWQERPTIESAIFVTGGESSWLESALPGREFMSTPSENSLTSFVERIGEGCADIATAWPEAWIQIRTVFRCVIPLSTNDSFFVPSFRGLVAVDEQCRYPPGLAIFHELSHSILSSYLEIIDLTHNPSEIISTPFSKTDGSVTSLIHSCWSFSRELSLYNRLRQHGLLPETMSLERVERKLHHFLKLGLDSLEKSADLTDYGGILVSKMQFLSRAA